MASFSAARRLPADDGAQVFEHEPPPKDLVWRRVLRSYTRVLHCSDPDEVGNNYEHDTNCDNKNGVGNEIREDHEDQPANQWDDRLLLPAVNEETEPE